jgi:molybdopterin synthase catalytic subunit
MNISIHFTAEAIMVPPPVLPSREIGATVEFLGIVRELENGEALAGLDYEAYEPMARKVLLRHFEELARVHRCAAVEFIHRTGWVPVGEASLWIRVLSSHRKEALAFMDEAIDRLKQDVPIWKRVS